mmetsp:Transcript_14174/g.25272  ORF Transcript_14174/g.25272 Transcript_14174/m.25272 type:complete len:92 (-) Transcript_14174:140-415(-)
MRTVDPVLKAFTLSWISRAESSRQNTKSAPARCSLPQWTLLRSYSKLCVTLNTAKCLGGLDGLEVEPSAAVAQASLVPSNVAAKICFAKML